MNTAFAFRRVFKHILTKHLEGVSRGRKEEFTMNPTTPIKRPREATQNIQVYVRVR